ncbi:MAG TPA: TlyA family RNA methyltransferase [Nitrospirae bacterium]|nr:16S/23S rRNA (cytidine-2'-O)-methyltransferase TlyA [bacterium BMS3Abin06]HDH11875.1 TlyA family RNA methyltransferase [Nitrospirota bacterium]HDZ02783.1 TlyA family RNA methyltransferase [Nitrospirota bacterium]
MPEKTAKKVRLDKLLFEKAIVESREKARAVILEGNVLVNGMVVDKAGALVKPDAALSVKSKMPYVGRGGLKLEHAIEYFGIEIKGKTAMDVGASTGGFTDCLLQHGAKKVYAIDVGYGQFSWILRNNDKIVLLEKTNIRYLDKALIYDEIDIATIDVSFISLLKVLPKVLEFLKPSGEIAALIKPQFEAGRKDVGKGGVVRDEKKRLEIIEKIKNESEKMGVEVKGITESPLKGPKGNVEYFIYLKKKQV